MIGFAAWIGTALLCVAPFIIDTDAGKVFMIVGLALLSLQAYEKECYNLILLNTIGAIGYAINLYL
tara:strand:- start:1035 stop:1232 length:198 start_codon:yes stop_codon:yes gene_type:complete